MTLRLTWRLPSSFPKAMKATTNATTPKTARAATIANAIQSPFRFGRDSAGTGAGGVPEEAAGAGAPQPGQAATALLISRPHSEHLIKAMVARLEKLSPTDA